MATTISNTVEGESNQQKLQLGHSCKLGGKNLSQNIFEAMTGYGGSITNKKKKQIKLKNNKRQP